MTASHEMTPHLPTVLVLSGHDPTGGAGLVADSEAVAACGGWALTVPTALTVQNCRNVSALRPVAVDDLSAMVGALEEFEIAAIKIGLIPDGDILDAVVDVLRRLPGVPVVLDPVLRAGGGSELSTVELIDAMCCHLLPYVDILTPNRQELARLAGAEFSDDTERAVRLMSLGCQALLVTGTDHPAERVAADRIEHTLHAPEVSRQWTWPRLTGSFHGSGCTLASALAARLAAGESLVVACEQAQAFTWQAVAHGWQPGQDQRLPRRLWQLPVRPPFLASDAATSG